MQRIPIIIAAALVGATAFACAPQQRYPAEPVVLEPEARRERVVFEDEQRITVRPERPRIERDVEVQPRTTAQPMNDEAIHDRVHQALRMAPDVQSRDIQVTVEDGNVTLKGFVENERDRERAHEIAHAVPGVRRVFIGDLRVQ